MTIEEIAFELDRRLATLSSIDFSSLSPTHARKLQDVSATLSELVTSLSFAHIVKRLFLMYVFACCLFTLVEVAFGVNAGTIALGNLAVALCFVASMTYKQYLCSTATREALARYDEVLNQVLSKR